MMSSNKYVSAWSGGGNIMDELGKIIYCGKQYCRRIGFLKPGTNCLIIFWIFLWSLSCQFRAVTGLSRSGEKEAALPHEGAWCGQMETNTIFMENLSGDGSVPHVDMPYIHRVAESKFMNCDSGMRFSCLSLMMNNGYGVYCDYELLMRKGCLSTLKIIFSRIVDWRRIQNAKMFLRIRIIFMLKY